MFVEKKIREDNLETPECPSNLMLLCYNVTDDSIKNSIEESK